MNDNTQLLLLGAAAAGLLGLLVVQQRRESFVSGDVVGIEIKREGIEQELHQAAAAVADSAQGLGCAYMNVMVEGIEASVRASKGRVSCGRVTDHIKKLENAIESRIKSSRLSQKTKDKLNEYIRQAIDAVRSVFDPLCEKQTFDPKDVRTALRAIKEAYCGALPTPLKDAAAKPPGLNDPALTAKVQSAQKALTEREKQPTNRAAWGRHEIVQLEAALSAARAELLASNIGVLKPSSSNEARALARAAVKAAETAQATKHTKWELAEKEARKAAAAEKTLVDMEKRARGKATDDTNDQGNTVVGTVVKIRRAGGSSPIFVGSSPLHDIEYTYKGKKRQHTFSWSITPAGFAESIQDLKVGSKVNLTLDKKGDVLKVKRYSG